MADHKRRLRRLVIDRVDTVAAGANPGAHVTLWKRHDGQPAPESTPTINKGDSPMPDNDDAALASLAEAIEVAKAEARAEALADVASLAPTTEAEPEQIDKSALPVEVRKALDAAEAQAAEAIAKADAASAEAAALRDAEQARIYKAKGEALAAVGSADDVAAVLRALSGDADVYAKAEALFSTAAERLAKSDLLAEAGHSRDTDLGTDLEAAIAKHVAEGASRAVAITKALEADPTLYQSPLAAR